jgi:hypothetical protein
VLLALALPALPADATANGDPASHVLPSKEVFVPFDPSLCSVAGRHLDALTEATRDAGYPIKVAVIATGEDLGTAYEMFGQPRRYARLLKSELPPALFRKKGRRPGYRLLVVMPGAAALDRADRKESRSLRRISIALGGDTEQLARVAIRAVSRLSKAAGHPVGSVRPKPPCPDIDVEPSASSDSGPWGAIGIAAALVAMVGLAVFLGRRGSTASGVS